MNALMTLFTSHNSTLPNMHSSTANDINEVCFLNLYGLAEYSRQLSCTLIFFVSQHITLTTWYHYYMKYVISL